MLYLAENYPFFFPLFILIFVEFILNVRTFEDECLIIEIYSIYREYRAYRLFNVIPRGQYSRIIRSYRLKYILYAFKSDQVSIFS